MDPTPLPMDSGRLHPLSIVDRDEAWVGTRRGPCPPRKAAFTCPVPTDGLPSESDWGYDALDSTILGWHAGWSRPHPGRQVTIFYEGPWGNFHAMSSTSLLKT